MIKEAGLFIISAGFLVYIIAPTSEKPEPEAQPVEIQTEAKNTSPAQQDTGSWENEEDEADTEPQFVFGEPMTGTDPLSEYDNESYDDDYIKINRQVAANNESSSNGVSANLASDSPGQSNNPRPGEPGSAENPLPLK